MKPKIRIFLISLVLSGCSAMSLWEAGALGAGAGVVTTMVLDDDADIIVDGAAVQTAESNAFSLLEVIIENAWSITLIMLLLWMLPSPARIINKIKTWRIK
jgi:hypothetical protein